MGPKYREPRPFTWKQNFRIIMNSDDDYTTGWAKREELCNDPSLNGLNPLDAYCNVKCTCTVGRLFAFGLSLHLMTPTALRVLITYMTNTSLYLPTRLLITSLLYVNATIMDVLSRNVALVDLSRMLHINTLIWIKKNLYIIRDLSMPPLTFPVITPISLHCIGYLNHIKHPFKHFLM